MPRYGQTSYGVKRPRESRISKPKKKIRTLERYRVPKPMTWMNCKRRWFQATYTWNTTTATGFWNVLQMSYNQIPSSSDYTNLFREYKINRIKVTFVPRYDNNDQTGAAAGSAMPMIHHKVETPYFVSPSGVYNASTLNTYLDTGAVSQPFNKPISVYFKPTLAADINNATVETTGPQWLTTGSPGNTQLHNGVSFFITFNGFTSPTATFTTDVYYEFFFSLRNPV